VQVRCFVRDGPLHAEGIVKCGGDRVWVAFRGCGVIQFYEGVKDFVGKDGMVVFEEVAGCVYDVYMESQWYLDVLLSFGGVTPACCL